MRLGAHRRHQSALGLLLVGVVLATMAAPRDVAAEQLTPQSQALLLLRVLAYDRNLKSRAKGGAVNLAIVYRSGDSGSDAAQAAMLAAIRDAATKLTVAGLPVRPTAVAYDARTIRRQLTDVGAVAIYVCPGIGSEISNLVSATRDSKTLSVTGDESEVRNGVGIGLVSRSGKASILVNLQGTKAEGADLDSALLRIAEVVR